MYRRDGHAAKLHWKLWNKFYEVKLLRAHVSVDDNSDCKSRENLPLDRRCLRTAVARVHTRELGTMRFIALKTNNRSIALLVRDSSRLREGALSCACQCFFWAFSEWPLAARPACRPATVASWAHVPPANGRMAINLPGQKFFRALRAQ